MLNEELPTDLINRFIYEIYNYVEGNPEASFISHLSENLKSSITESIKSEFSDFIQEHVVPSIRNVEIQTAIQVSKTNEFYAELKKITDYLSAQLSKTNDLISLVKGSTTSSHEKIDTITKSISKKADTYELQVLAREVSQMTPLSTFYNFQDWAQSLAAKSEIARLDLDLQEVRKDLKIRPTFEQMQNEDSKIIVDFKSEIKKIRESVNRKIEKIREELSENDEKIELAKSKIQQSNEILSKRISEVMDYVLEKPWVPDLSEVSKEISKKSNKEDLEKIKSEIEPKLQDILLRSMDIERDLKEYSDVMARFDEVILTKSSKEDVGIVKQMMKNFVLQMTFDPIFTEISEKILKIEEKIQFQDKSIFEVSKEIASYSATSALLKTQTKDYTKIIDSIKSMTEAMKYKADKSDIYNMFDVVGYRDDVIALSTAVEKIKDLFTQSVVLQHETIGTFAPSADPQVTKNRLRAEIGKNLDIILRKLNTTPEKLERSPKSRSKLSSMGSIRIETTVDEKLLSTRTSSTKHRRVSSAAGHKRLI